MPISYLEANVKTILLLASGTKDGGGSVCKHILKAIGSEHLKARVMGIASQYPRGGVNRLADQRGTPFIHIHPPFDKGAFQTLIPVFGGEPDLVVSAGFTRKIVGLKNIPTVNCHPAPLPEFGGHGMYGLVPHEKVIAKGRRETAITIHWVNKDYDAGEIIFTHPIPVLHSDTPESLQARVKEYEWHFYPRVIDLILKDQLDRLHELTESYAPV